MSIPLETLQELEALRQRVEELEYDLASLKSTAETEVVALMDYYDLTATEGRLVRALAYAAGAPLSRPTIAEAVCGEIEDLRTVDSHVKRIRGKVGGRLPIDSIYGIGYRLLPDTAKEAREVMAGRLQPHTHRAHFYGQIAAE